MDIIEEIAYWLYNYTDWVDTEREKEDEGWLKEARQLRQIFIKHLREVVEGAELCDEVHFLLHFDTSYKLLSKEMDAFLKGIEGGSQAMKQAILKALEVKK